ncbi:MAG: radical SAM protein [Methylocystis sp.]|nr:radical SAM protein [Methylocystis sp.]
MSEQHKPSKLVYRKADSFVVLNGAEPSLMRAAIDRVARLAATLVSEPGAHRRAILKRACDDLLAPAQERRAFRLRPFVAAEMALLSDAMLPRYLSYRYRYDVFPVEYRLDGFPPCVQIEVTSFCNFRCVFCYQKNPDFKRRSNGFMGFMKPEMFKRVVDQLEGHVEAVTMASRGEPLSSSDICEMLAYLPGKFLAAKMNTNASFLDERRAHAILQSGISTLVFSVDAAVEPLYSSLRVGGTLEVVERNIRRFAEIRRKHYPDVPLITRISGVRFSDAQDVEHICRYWQDAVDQVAFVDYCPLEDIYAQPETGIETPCSELWRRLFVLWNGSIEVCEPDFREVHKPCRIDEWNITDVWLGDYYQRLRQHHFDGQRQAVEPCCRCPVE